MNSFLYPLLRPFWKLLRQASYSCWVQQYDSWTPFKEKRLQQRVQEIDPTRGVKISVILPVYNPPLKFLKEAIHSVQTQIWENWELCIVDDASQRKDITAYLKGLEKEEPRVKIEWHTQQQGIVAATNSALELATGTFVAFLDHDDLLSPAALGEIAVAIDQAPQAAFLYSDEDKINEKGQRCDPFFKPDWNPDLLTSLNYCSHLTVLRRSLILELGGLREGFAGAQDWDLLLRVTEKLETTQIIHIPRILYHWRISKSSTASSITAKPYIIEASQKTLEEHLMRLGRSFKEIKKVHEGGHWQVQYHLPEPCPFVSIIIPTRNQKELLEQCLQSILSKTTYSHYEILIVDNDSSDPEVFSLYEKLVDGEKLRRISIPGSFNYSSLNNRAVTEAKGEIVVLLNNDIEVLHSTWLEELVVHAIRPEVGAVGALLYYPNKRIQHAGVILGLAGPMRIGGVAGHIGKHFLGYETVGGNRLNVVQNFSAVTGACLAVRKKLYQEVGGLDEEFLPVSFNDVDFCLKLQAAGYWNVWTPFSTSIHHESVSRGKDRTPQQKKRAQQEVATMRQRWGPLLDNDPAYNPNLTFISENWGLAKPPRIS